MNKLSTPLNLLAIAILVAPVSSFAESWSCRHDDNVREVHIKHATDSAVPCSVVYRKLTEGAEDKVLWTANNDAAYCAEKAKAFVAKQESWGWTCVETISEENKADEMTAPAATTAPAAEPAEVEEPELEIEGESAD